MIREYYGLIFIEIWLVHSLMNLIISEALGKGWSQVASEEGRELQADNLEFQTHGREVIRNAKLAAVELMGAPLKALEFLC